MNKYNDLELSILSCLLQRPELMKNVILEDKHFKKHLNIWIFMKSVYEKFGTFDMTIIINITKNRHQMCEYIMWLYDKEPAPSLFEMYKKQLIDEFEKSEKDKYIINNIYILANDLFVGNISTERFKEKCDEIYEKAN